MMLLLCVVTPYRPVGIYRRFGKQTVTAIWAEDGDGVVLRNDGIYRWVYKTLKPNEHHQPHCRWEPKIHIWCYITDTALNGIVSLSSYYYNTE
jgi:hypothetical protein